MAGQLTCNVFPTCSVTDCESTLTDWESILVAKDYWYMSSWLLRWNSMKRNVLASWRPVGPEKADRAGLLLTGLCHWRSQLMTEFYLSIDGDLIHLFFDFSRRRLVDLISCSSRGLFFLSGTWFRFCDAGSIICLSEHVLLRLTGLLVRPFLYPFGAQSALCTNPRPGRRCGKLLFFFRLPKRRRRRPNRWMTSGKNVVKQGRLRSCLFRHWWMSLSQMALSIPFLAGRFLFCMRQ